MLCRALLLGIIGLLVGGSASAGEIYEVVSQDGDKTITYMVQFGGTQREEQFTAFDPDTKKFVHLSWKRGENPPAPKMKVWDHRTGETISLYQFANAKNPLPVIPSMAAMKFCPLTNDKNFKAKAIIAVD